MSFKTKHEVTVSITQSLCSWEFTAKKWKLSSCKSLFINVHSSFIQICQHWKQPRCPSVGKALTYSTVNTITVVPWCPRGIGSRTNPQLGIPNSKSAPVSSVKWHTSYLPITYAHPPVYFTSPVRVHAQSCLTLGHRRDCSPPASSVHRIFLARILEWVTISSFRRSNLHLLQVSCIGRQILYHWATGKPLNL